MHNLICEEASFSSIQVTVSSMTAGSFDLQGLAFLGIAAGIAIVLAFGVMRLCKGVWRWMFAVSRTEQRARVEPYSNVPPSVVADPKLTATHILAIKSNLDAVSRQLADLELKLRSYS
jgi:hypothetical protein